MNAFLAAALSVVLQLAPAAVQAQAQAGCPASEPRLESRVATFLSLPHLDELRKAGLDLGSASAADVHALSGEADREACVALRRAMASSGRRPEPGERLAFYRSRDRYFVPIAPVPRPRPPGVTIRLGYDSFLEVYDSEFRFVARLSA